MLKSALLAAALIPACIPGSVRAAADPAALRQAVDAAILPVMRQYDVPGMAVAVTVDGKPAFFSYGVASRAAGTPVTEATLFELGSVSKTFTATLAAYAQEQGKLSLNQHPGRYLPQLKGSAVDHASLLHLATYTAGGFPQQIPDDVTTQAQLFSYFQHWKPDAAPGSQRRYSNPSIGLFGHITGLALGGSFGELAERSLFPKLGLQHTYIHVPQQAMGDYAWGYAESHGKDQAVRVRPDLFDAEAYGVKTSAADMMRYVQAQIDPSALEPSMQRAVQATHIGYFKVGPMTQGLGWEAYPYPVTLDQLLDGNSGSMLFDPHVAQALAPAPYAAPTLFNKTGSTRGFGSYVMFIPEKRIGIVLLANRAFPIDARIKTAYAILARLEQQ